MSRVIALEASSENCSVAVLDGNNSFFKLSDKPRAHASVLLPLLDELLVQSGVSLHTVDTIVLTHGPGSFTGIRIAMSVAQGLAYGACLPVVPVSTLELLAYQARQTGRLEKAAEAKLPCYVVPMIDARMDEIYWAAYRVEGEKLHEISKPAVDSADAINSALASLKITAGLVGVGNGWTLEKVRHDFLRDCDENLMPNARDLAHFGKKLMDEGRLENIADVQPLYLRNEVSWNKRVRIRNK